MRLEKALADERADPVEAPVGPITEPATESQESAPAAQQEPASHDPKHTLAMADGFGFNGKKQLEQTKWKVTVAPGSKR